MTVSKTNIPERLAETLIIDTVANATGADNVFTAVTLANKIYSFRVDNSAVAAVSYVKGQIATAYNSGNNPHVRFYAPANAIVEYVFPEGWPTGGMTTGFSFIGTSTAANNNSQADPTGNGSVKVTILAGT
tara:strand:+ start:291 stop:683 length:393 start_codon:yes stop_codon:yes gene_type:complete